MSIRPLTKDVIDKIRSSAAVTSLNDVACGLLKNALDANSSKVNIHLDYLLGNCIAEDDGIGIELFEFEESGGLGKLHYTSKQPPNPQVHGSHGNFIASVATFSFLRISSLHHQSQTHAALSIHNGTVLARSIPAQPDHRVVPFIHGTRVSVHDLFGSMPVRVKQRGIIFSDRTKVDREWDVVVKEIAALLLSWPSRVSVFLRESNTKREARLQAGNSDLICRTSRLFIQAGLAQIEDTRSWVPVSACSCRVRIKGAISTNPVATRRSQLMCLGIRPIQNKFGTNALFEEVNKIFRSSNFGTLESAELEKKQPKPTKGIERWPMFYLEIHLLGVYDGLALVDVLDDSRHILQTVIELLKVTCYGFLKKHWFQPKFIREADAMPTTSRLRSSSKIHKKPKAMQTGLWHKNRLEIKDSPTAGNHYALLDSWQRIKTGDLTASKRLDERPGNNSTIKKMFSSKKTRQLADKNRAATIEKSCDSVNQAQSLAQPDVDKNISGENSLHIVTNCQRASSPSSTSELSASRDTKSCQTIEFRSDHRPQEWLQDVLRSWENPVFNTTEMQIPSLPQTAAFTENSAEVRCGGLRSKFFLQENKIEFEAISMSLNRCLSRRALDTAKIIGQVDKKYILLQLPLLAPEEIPLRASSALIMLDQHAADERFRLEQLMSTYFRESSHGVEAAVVRLRKPIVFELSAREEALLQRIQDHFQTWGIVIESHQTQSVEEQEVFVSGLPPTILERCRSDPKLLIDIVRKEIWKFEDRAMPPRPTHEAGRPWVSCFHNCPQGILELLHSRSCRSAIMFNDHLSFDECQNLVRRLSQCAFPFQCAHGRPSMVPLVDIGSGSGRLGSWSERRSEMCVFQWKNWLNST